MADQKLTMTGIGEIAIGILVLIVIYALVPVIGSSVQSATVIPAGSVWNSSVTSGIPTSVSLWTTLAPFLNLAPLILIVAGFLTTLKGLKGGQD